MSIAYRKARISNWLLALLVLLMAGIFLYLSLVPSPAMVKQSWLPRSIAKWADHFDTLRTGIAMIPLGVITGYWLKIHQCRLGTWFFVWSDLSALVGLTELLQHFLPKRVCDWRDIVWGSLGAAVGLFIVWTYSRFAIYRKTTKNIKAQLPTII